MAKENPATEARVRLIKELRAEGLSWVRIADKLNVTPQAAHSLARSRGLFTGTLPRPAIPLRDGGGPGK